MRHFLQNSWLDMMMYSIFFLRILLQVISDVCVRFFFSFVTSKLRKNFSWMNRLLFHILLIYFVILNRMQSVLMYRINEKNQIRNVSMPKVYSVNAYATAHDDDDDDDFILWFLLLLLFKNGISATTSLRFYRFTFM